MTINLLNGFYASSLFWAGDPINFPDESVPKDLREQMATVAYRHKTNNYTISICKDGMFIITVNALETLWKNPSATRVGVHNKQFNEYLKYINCLILLLESALLKATGENWIFNQEITRKDIVLVYFENNMFNVASVPADSTVELLADSRRIESVSRVDSSWHRLKDRESITQNVFELMFQDADIVLSKPANISLVATLMKSLSEYRMADKETSLILSWFIIETYLYKKWNTWLDSKKRDYKTGKKRINADRRKTLNDGRNYSASTVSNILELVDEIPFNTFEEITKLRKIRNDIVHQDIKRNCTYEHCRSGLTIAAEMISADLNTNIDLDLSHPIY